MVSVAVLKIGGLLLQPMGRTRGNAIWGSSPSAVHRKNQTQLGDVIYIQVHIIETITDVHFDKMNWPKGGVSEQNFTKDAVKSMAKLHGLQSCKRKSVIIDIIPTVVTNPLVLSITFRYNTRRR